MDDGYSPLDGKRLGKPMIGDYGLARGEELTARCLCGDPRLPPRANGANLAIVPIGTHHEETGWLNLREGQYLLRRDGGGTWQLEFGVFTEWRARRLLGRRVRVKGVRMGFDVLSAKNVLPPGLAAAVDRSTRVLSYTDRRG